jgi:putative DNA primase/helicase
MGTPDDGPQGPAAGQARATNAGPSTDAPGASAGWQQGNARADGFSEVPAELTSRRQWVDWRWQRSAGGRLTKVPYSPRTGQLASSTDPETWGTFEEAKAADEAMAGTGGIGFVLNGDGIVGVDLDHCIDTEGKFAPWAQGIIQRLDSYNEISPSGRGVHILIRGVLPSRGRRKRYLGEGSGEDGRRSAIEIYDRARYFAMTGRRLWDRPETIRERRVELQAVYAEYLADRGASNGTRATNGTAPADGDPAAGLVDTELIEKAACAENGEKFQRLWRGDIEGYGSQSEADLALCRIFHFWTRGDACRIDRLFRQSGLMRAKWDEKHFADGRTYGEGTIARAVELGGAVYKGGRRAGHTHGASAAAGAGLVSGEETTAPRADTSFPTTDLGNAQRLVALRGKDLRYCHPWKRWFVWDGRRWVIDATGEVMRRAKETVRSIYGEAQAAEIEGRRRELAAHAVRSEAGPRLREMVILAQSEPGIPVMPDALDADPWVLNVANGTLDLRNGELLPHRREDLITRLAPTDYDPDAACPAWEEALHTFMAG